MRIALNRSSSHEAFTLIEMVLAIGVAAIVLVTVTSAFFSGLRLREATQDLVDDETPVDQALATMERDIQCIVTPTNGTSKVLSGDFRVGNVVSSGNSTPVAIEMFTATGQLSDKEPWGDIQRVTYELRAPATGGNAQGKDLIRSVTRDLLTAATPEVQDQWMMGGIQSMTISCYDGSQWWNTWDTTGLTSGNTNLPAAVRVDIQQIGENESSPIEIIVPIDSQARTNMTTSTGGTGGTGTGTTSGAPGG